MKLGVEGKDRWKAYVFGALVVGFALYYFWPDSSSSSPAPKVTKTAVPAIPAPDASQDNEPTRRRANGRVAGDFRPKLRESNRDKRPDLTKIDPTIKLALLARVQNVTLEGGARNIFQFGQAAPVTPVPTGPIPPVKPIIPGKVISAAPVPTPPSGPPPEPQAPPIPFKYYGYSAVKGDTRKRAFFLDGEDVIVAWEGDMIKNRYKVVHVGLKSVELDDTQFKNGKQSLPLAEEAAT